MMKPPFDWYASALDTPRQRRRVGNLKRGWCSGHTRNTILARHYDLRLFTAFALDEELAPPSDTAHVHAALVVLGLLRRGPAYAQDAVLQFVQTHPGQSASLLRCVSTLRSWAAYLHDKREVTRSLDAMPTPKVAELRQRSNARSENLASEGVDLGRLSPISKTRAYRFASARDAAIAEVLAHSTLKRHQLQRLRWGDVEFGDDVELLTPARLQVDARNNGRRVPYHLVLRATAALKRWHRVYVEQFGRASFEAAVFSDVHGQPMRPLGLDELMDLYAG